MTIPQAFLFFELDGATYAVRGEQVQHVDMLDHITPVPNTALGVDGVVFSRGAVVPAVNLRTRFGRPPQAPSARTRLIFVRHEDRLVALIVDSAREFRTFPAGAVRPLEETLHGVAGSCVAGHLAAEGRTVLLVDLAAVLDLGGPVSTPVPTPSPYSR